VPAHQHPHSKRQATQEAHLGEFYQGRDTKKPLPQWHLRSAVWRCLEANLTTKSRHTLPRIHTHLHFGYNDHANLVLANETIRFKRTVDGETHPEDKPKSCGPRTSSDPFAFAVPHPWRPAFGQGNPAGRVKSLGRKPIWEGYLGAEALKAVAPMSAPFHFALLRHDRVNMSRQQHRGAQIRKTDRGGSPSWRVIWGPRHSKLLPQWHLLPIWDEFPATIATRCTIN